MNLGPLGFITGVVLGSAASISAVLAMVLVVFLVASSDHPSMVGEYRTLVVAVIQFGILAVAAGVAFATWQRDHRWRWQAQAAMWLLLAVISWSYWPQDLA
ncbi:MAG: hypothetical protein ACO4AL_06185 [Steroidobacteraceae bacterium]|jgi:hypothetical protein